MTSASASIQHPITRVEKILAAAERLPKDLKDIFDDAFLYEKPDAQICAERNLTPAQLNERRSNALRSLRAASS